MSIFRYCIAGCSALLAILLVVGMCVGQPGNQKLIASTKNLGTMVKNNGKAAIANNALAEAKKLNNTEEPMTLFKARKKGGLGIGDKPGAATVDGIEQMLNDLALGIPRGRLIKEAAMIEDMAYRIIAIGEIATHFAPKKDKGEASGKNWKKLLDEMMEGADALAKAAKIKDLMEVTASASKVSVACINCHKIFRK